MNGDIFTALLIFLGVITAAVLWVSDRTNRRASDSIPPSMLPVVEGLLTLAGELAKRTSTPLDDEIVEKLREVVSKR